MGNRSNRRRRGEGNTEYVVLLMFVIICAVVGLFTSYSGTIKKIQLEKGLCIDCTQRDSAAIPPKNGSTPPSDSPKPTANASLGSAPSDPSAHDWWTAFKDFLSWW